ncbi:ankyrin repeat domain-containing protein [Emticicia sp. BO119]|uniref:ankyrin repeat domain-containing protein n=1 Tax=Emticicia sp. BO119 TaxID=2757768 RepID=UPI0015F0EB9F|nr:ankyrin repeat domain-containing protein [Emticicia sp. BO119]MBA4850666.1 ankyrin repeat domain-containing protein [Emticicia sp. BO119]
MIQPIEMKTELPMYIANKATSTTIQVWKMLYASYEGDIDTVQALYKKTPELIYAQYNYTPPIHFAVREGHYHLVEYLLQQGAYSPDYKTYPFLDSLFTVALDRGYDDIAFMLQQYTDSPTRHKYKGDNGEILYKRRPLDKHFEETVDNGYLDDAEKLLKVNPELVHDETFFWAEGILMMPAKDNNKAMVELLLSYSAKVPVLLKWAQAYYFKHLDMATYLMNKGMNPGVMSWHHVTLLHDMAQKGFIDKADLLIKHGADLNPVEEEYQSTPLGLAARWGHLPMVEYLLEQGADPHKAGADWATPLAWAKKKGHTEIENALLKYTSK